MQRASTSPVSFAPITYEELTPLAKAFEEGGVAGLRRFLSAHPGCRDTRFSGGMTALSMAIAYTNPDAVALLLEKDGASLEILNEPISDDEMVAATSPLICILNVLPTTATRKIVATLLKHLKTIKFDGTHVDPFRHAMGKGDIPTIKMFLDAGARSMLTKNSYSSPAIATAACAGKFRGIRYLVEKEGVVLENVDIITLVKDCLDDGISSTKLIELLDVFWPQFNVEDAMEILVLLTICIRVGKSFPHRERVVYWLLNHGADIVIDKIRFETLLHLAVKRDDEHEDLPPNFLLRLFEYGCALNARDTAKETPAMLAVRSNRPLFVDTFCVLANQVDEATKVEFYRQTDEQGHSLLMNAASRGHEKVVKALLKRKDIDANYVSPDRLTAMHVALRSGSVDCAEELVFADKQIFSSGMLFEEFVIESLEIKGHGFLETIVEFLNSLMARIQHKDIPQFVSQLVSFMSSAVFKEISAEMQTQMKRQINVLHLVSSIFETETEAEADQIVDKISAGKFTFSDGETVERLNETEQTFLLSYSAMLGREAIVTALIENKLCTVDVHVESFFNKTALMLAAEAGQDATVARLIALGADLTCRNHNGENAWHAAATKNHLEVVDALGTCPDKQMVEKSINALTSLGRAPLFLVTSAAMVDKLCEHGADVNAGRGTLSPLLTAGAANVDVLDALVRHGAPLKKRDCDGHSVLACAVINGHSDMVRRLGDRNGKYKFDVRDVPQLKIYTWTLEMVKALHDIGYDFTQPTSEGSMLHWLDDADALDFVLKLKCIDPKTKNAAGDNALVLASTLPKEIDFAKIKVLAEHCKELLNSVDHEGRTILQRLLMDEHFVTAKQLIECCPWIDLDDPIYDAVALERGGRQFHMFLQNKIAERKLFLDGVEMGDEALVEDYFAGDKVNLSLVEANKALHMAVKHKNLSTLEKLCRKGFPFDVNAMNAKGQTPLMVAASMPDGEAVVEILCAHHANVNVIVMAQKVAATTVFEDDSDENEETAARDDNEENVIIRPPLISAILNGNLAAVRVLLGAGANPNTLFNDASALQHAIEYTRPDDPDFAMVRLLLAAGASLHPRQRISAIHTAAYYDRALVLAFLLEQPDADKNAVWNHNTALHYACLTGSLDATIKLLDAGVEIDPMDHRHQTPLMYAARMGHELVVEELIARGACVEAVNRHGISALGLAAQEKQIETMLLLCESVEDRNEAGQTHPALHLALETDETEVVDALLDNGVEIDTQDANGLTALQQAIRRGQASMVEHLLRRGASVNAMLAFAVREKNNAMVMLLLNHCTLSDEEIFDALVLTVELGLTSIRDSLIDAGAPLLLNGRSVFAVIVVNIKRMVEGKILDGNPGTALAALETLVRDCVDLKFGKTKKIACEAFLATLKVAMEPLNTHPTFHETFKRMKLKMKQADGELSISSQMSELDDCIKYLGKLSRVMERRKKVEEHEAKAEAAKQAKAKKKTSVAKPNNDAKFALEKVTNFQTEAKNFLGALNDLERLQKLKGKNSFIPPDADLFKTVPDFIKRFKAFKASIDAKEKSSYKDIQYLKLTVRDIKEIKRKWKAFMIATAGAGGGAESDEEEAGPAPAPMPAPALAPAALPPVAVAAGAADATSPQKTADARVSQSQFTVFAFGEMRERETDCELPNEVRALITTLPRGATRFSPQVIRELLLGALNLITEPPAYFIDHPEEKYLTVCAILAIASRYLRQRSGLAIPAIDNDLFHRAMLLEPTADHFSLLVSATETLFNLLNEDETKLATQDADRIRVANERFMALRGAFSKPVAEVDPDFALCFGALQRLQQVNTQFPLSNDSPLWQRLLNKACIIHVCKVFSLNYQFADRLADARLRDQETLALEKSAKTKSMNNSFRRAKVEKSIDVEHKKKVKEEYNRHFQRAWFSGRDLEFKRLLLLLAELSPVFRDPAAHEALLQRLPEREQALLSKVTAFYVACPEARPSATCALTC